MSQIAIIGLGSVGASTALSLIHQRTPATLLLVDTKSTLRDAQARDLADAALVHGTITQVRTATHREASQADVVVITAGAKYTPGETSLQHLYQKISILKSILNEMKPFNPQTIILIVSNPVDLLTTLAQDLSGLPRHQVLGSGTCLETLRLNNKVTTLPGFFKKVDGYMVGVRGRRGAISLWPKTCDSVSWEEGKVVMEIGMVERMKMESEVKERTRAIVAGKGGAEWGIGAVVGGLCCDVLGDRREVRTVSCWRGDWGCCFGWPVVVGRGGVVEEVDVEVEMGLERGRFRDVFEEVEGDGLDDGGWLELEEGVLELKNMIDRVRENGL